MGDSRVALRLYTNRIYRNKEKAPTEAKNRKNHPEKKHSQDEAPDASTKNKTFMSQNNQKPKTESNQTAPKERGEKRKSEEQLADHEPKNAKTDANRGGFSSLGMAVSGGPDETSGFAPYQRDWESTLSLPPIKTQEQLAERLRIYPDDSFNKIITNIDFNTLLPENDDLRSFLRSLPEHADKVIQYILENQTTFNQLFKTSNDLIVFVNAFPETHGNAVIKHLLKNEAAFNQVFKKNGDLKAFITSLSPAQAEKAINRLFKKDAKQSPIEKMFIARVLEKNDYLKAFGSPSLCEYIDLIILHVATNPTTLNRLFKTADELKEFRDDFREDVERALNILFGKPTVFKCCVKTKDNLETLSRFSPENAERSKMLSIVLNAKTQESKALQPPPSFSPANTSNPLLSNIVPGVALNSSCFLINNQHIVPTGKANVVAEATEHSLALGPSSQFG